MGKGQRIRAARDAEKESMKAELARKAKKAKITKITTAIIAAILVVSLVVGVVWNSIYTAAYNKGTIQRDTIILKSDNYAVDAAMMSFFYYSQLNSWASSLDLSQLGIDTSVSLRRQDCSFQDGTWFDYFCDAAGEQAKNLVYLSEKALEEGMKLDDSDKNEVQDTLDAYYEQASENNMDKDKFLSAVFGTGVNESDVRKCLELSQLAAKYQESYLNSLTYTDAEIEKYYTDNIDSYRYVDYYSYAVVADDTDDQNTFDAAKKKANELAAVNDVNAFKSWVEKNYIAENPVSEELTAEKQKEGLDTVLGGLYSQQVLYDEEDTASEWMFKTGKAGQTYVADDGEGTYTVYFLTKAPYRDETKTRTIRNIILTNETYGEDKIKETADKIVKEMKEAGLKEETFKKYALEYSEQTDTAANGGLCEDYKQSSYEGNIGSWAYNANRKIGDFEAIKIDGGYAVCYYVGEGIPAWKSDCLNAKKNADYDTAYEKWTKEFAVTENSKGYKKIPDLV